MLPYVTVTGRAVDDPDLRFTQSGKAVANVRVAASERRKTDNGEWEDGDRIFLSLSLWGQEAEDAAEHVRKGDKVLAEGRLYEREYETRNGEQRKSIELKWATLALVPGGRPQAQRQRSTNGNRPADNYDPWANSQPPAPNSDPWAGHPDPWATPGNGNAQQEPPF